MSRAFKLQITFYAIRTTHFWTCTQSAFGVLKHVIVTDSKEVGECCKSRDAHTSGHIWKCCGVTHQMTNMNDIWLNPAKHPFVNLTQRGLLISIFDAAVG